ncbi:uncharacterized protein [Euphorbia lathyris]|uniref:uncharacterized protein n=1 Tax=Euphorbia lathyris TaxID=212925 RepID=UPI003314410C
MTADVNANVNVNVSTSDTEDRCGLDMNGDASLPTTVADCNGYRNGSETGNGKGNAEDDPDASYIFVAGNDVVADEPAADASNLNGKSEPVVKVGSGDVEVDNDAAKLVVDHRDGDVGSSLMQGGGGSPVKNELPLNGEKEGIDGAVEVPNGCHGVVEAEQDGVDLSREVERSEELQINDVEPDSENKSLLVSVGDEKAEEDDIIGSTPEESQVTNNADIAESESNHSDKIEVESDKNIAESEECLSSEAEVISSIYIAESEGSQSGLAEVISSNNIAESEQSKSGEAEVISSNYIDDTEQNRSGKVEVSSTMDVAESELNQSGNTEGVVEVGRKLDLVSSIEENQDSSPTIPVGVQDDNDVDLNHGSESVGVTTNVSEGPQEASEVELNTEETSCLVEAGVNLERAEIIDATLSSEYVNGVSDGCAEDSLAETSILNGIAGASQTTTMQNGGSEELRSGNLTSSDAEIGMSIPAASDDDSIRDSKSEFNMPVRQLESETINGHVTYQNGESLPIDHAEECDSNTDFSHASQTSPEKDRSSEVYEAVSSDDIAIVNNESNPVDPVRDTALEVDNGHLCPSDTTSKPVVYNGHPCPSDTASEPVVDNGHPCPSDTTSEPVVDNGHPCPSDTTSEPVVDNGHPSDTASESVVDNGHPCPSDTASEPIVDNGHPCPSDTTSEPVVDNGHPSDTASESVVDNGHPRPSDTTSEPVVDNGHSHPIHDSEIYGTKTETVDAKLKAYGSDSVGPHFHSDREVLIDPESHPLVMKEIPSPQGNTATPETEADIVAIKSDAVPALSSDVVNIESEVSATAANNFREVPDSAEDPDKEACADDSVENAVDVKAESKVEISFMLPREVPHDDCPASEFELVENPVDVKAESEVEEPLVVPREVPHDGCPASESVSVENPIDVTADSEAENSSTVLAKLPHGDVPASESEVLDVSVHSDGGSQNCIHNDVQVENKGNSVDGDEKTPEAIVDAKVDNQGEASSSSPEGIDGQNLVAEGEKRRFYYMIRIPRYDNGENLREQIKHAQNQVDEKTKSRDAIRAEMQKQRACCNEFGACLDDAISEETAARDLLKAKRREMDSVLLVINKVKSARDVEEINSKIRNMEHMLQHETLALKEEKNYIRAIQQLKQTREQLSSSLGKQEGVQEALNQKEEVEERMKVLRKEADQLRENVFKAEGATKIANKKFQDEKAKLNNLTMQFRAADDVRQKAYADLQSLRKQSYDKNKYFWKYKDDAKAAYDLASKGDKDELQSHCINQVEKVMELWNSNDEFRKDYYRCNIRSTLRRLRTLDGRSLGPDEEPLVIPYVNERAVKENTITSISTLEEENKVAPAKTEKDHKSPEKSGDQIKPTAESKKPAKPAPSGNVSAVVSQRNEIEEAPQQEDENKPTKEEAELIRKAEELRKEQEAAMLREQRRMEEKAKAKEAMERKKRNADKAQARAALRAQKEAEQKEKEREKRAKKKEKRKAVEEVNVLKEEEESAPSSEIQHETKVSEKPMVAQTKRSQKPLQFTKQTKSKSIPPLPLRNRSKRRMQTWMWALVAVLVLLSLFLVGNSGFGYSFGFGLQRFGF